ncbi:hypothetical protein PSI15_10945 [Xenorhabdus sp. PR6a]|uniref:hypothetical protein n=1 Tax=Xenorhabdus sp. PR6a TaxID=3025877 RepID=UPI00235A4290|nr:hypothetical protein [Xenorhabdus sp. PR6a]MDC9582075.1 hypothetical protein [Xenorhabdus sp. PR6a]
MNKNAEPGKKRRVAGVISFITGWSQVKNYTKTVRNTLGARTQTLKQTLDDLRMAKEAANKKLDKIGNTPFADFRATEHQIEQARETFLRQKRLALAGVTVCGSGAIFALILTIMALFTGEPYWIIRATSLVVIFASFLLVCFMSALHIEFSGWKLVNRINTHAEGATFAAFRAENGLNKTLRFGQCGFKRGEK